MNLLNKASSVRLSAIQQGYTQINRAAFVAYKSSIALENLYPNSNLHIKTPTKPECSMSSKFSGYIPMDQLDISYTRSSGPGGQNVNKVNTKVNLRFQLESANWLDNDIKAKLADKFKTRITKEGYMIFRSDLTRSQQLNLADCLNKLRTCIAEAAFEAPTQSPETAEKIRRRQENAARERLIQKRFKSQTKSDRQPPTIKDM